MTVIVNNRKWDHLRVCRKITEKIRVRPFSHTAMMSHSFARFHSLFRSVIS